MFHPAAPRLLLRLVDLQRKKGEAPHLSVPMVTDHYRRLPIYLDHMSLDYTSAKNAIIPAIRSILQNVRIFLVILLHLLSKRGILRLNSEFLKI